MTDKDEDDTYEELAIGHLLKRQEELQLIISHRAIYDSDSVLKEMIDANNKISEFYKKNGQYDD